MYAENSMTKARNNLPRWDTAIWTYSNAKFYKAFVLHWPLWLATSPSSLSAFQYCLKHCAQRVSRGVCSLNIALCSCFPVELFNKKASVCLGFASLFSPLFLEVSLPQITPIFIQISKTTQQANELLQQLLWEDGLFFFLKIAFLLTCVLFSFPSF